MDKIINIYKINKKILMCFLIISIIGIISGSVFYTILSNTDKTAVNESIVTFFNNINSNQIDYSNSLKTGLITNILFTLSIWLLGISVIGLPLIFIFYFFKTFALGFTVVSIISNYAFKGIIYAFIYVFPHNMINVFAYAFLSIYALICSYNTLQGFIKKSSIDFKPIMSRYRYILFTTLLIVILSSLYQTFAMPYILKIVLKFIK